MMAINRKIPPILAATLSAGTDAASLPSRIQRLGAVATFCNRVRMSTFDDGKEKQNPEASSRSFTITTCSSYSSILRTLKNLDWSTSRVIHASTIRQ